MPGIEWIGFGTQEAGYVTGGTTLVPVSKTTKDGVDLQLNSTFVDAYGGMDVLPADSRQERGELTLGMTFLRADLTTFRFALGLPDGALTGDLSAGTPTAEVLAVDAGDIGSTRRHLYALGPGPASTRKI